MLLAQRPNGCRLNGRRKPVRCSRAICRRFTISGEGPCGHHMTFLLLKATTSSAVKMNHSLFFRLLANRPCQYASIPTGSSVLIEGGEGGQPCASCIKILGELPPVEQRSRGGPGPPPPPLPKAAAQGPGPGTWGQSCVGVLLGDASRAAARRCLIRF